MLYGNRSKRRVAEVLGILVSLELREADVGEQAHVDASLKTPHN